MPKIMLILSFVLPMVAQAQEEIEKLWRKVEPVLGQPLNPIAKERLRAAKRLWDDLAGEDEIDSLIDQGIDLIRAQYFAVNAGTAEEVRWVETFEEESKSGRGFVACVCKRLSARLADDARKAAQAAHEDGHQAELEYIVRVLEQEVLGDGKFPPQAIELLLQARQHSEADEHTYFEDAVRCPQYANPLLSAIRSMWEVYLPQLQELDESAVTTKLNRLGRYYGQVGERMSRGDRVFTAYAVHTTLWHLGKLGVEFRDSLKEEKSE